MFRPLRQGRGILEPVCRGSGLESWVQIFVREEREREEKEPAKEQKGEEAKESGTDRKEDDKEEAE